MATITFTGVSPRSLGDLLKGYGLMALIGERWPETVFWWDAAGHLVAQRPDSASEESWKRDIAGHICSGISDWAVSIGREFAPERGDRNNGKQKRPSKLTRQVNFDSFDVALASAAWAAAIPDRPTENADTRSHPWFGAHGQDGSGDYFATLRDLALRRRSRNREVIAGGLDYSLYRSPGVSVANSKNELLGSGGVFFPEPMKRYATGVSKWICEGDAPVSRWCYALALYGALSLRGSLRRIRLARSDYPSFPFVFEGANAWEVHLPVWSEKHPRTLREWRMQIAQFQVRVKGDALAANAVEFRAAVASRGVAAGFDRFYRFVLEPRRPGQKQDQYLQQGILRGVTRVGARDTADIRLLVAPLAERHWLDRLKTKRRSPSKPKPEQLQRQACREMIEQAIHAAIDEPRPETALGILRALWKTNQVLARQALGSENQAESKVPPAPVLPAVAWERALAGLLQESAEHRIARAIGSILGARESGDPSQSESADEDNTSSNVQPGDAPKQVGGILWQLLPIDMKPSWRKDRGASVLAWRGAAPEQEFAELLRRRWLCSLGAGIRHLALRGRRTAPLADIVRLLRGELDIKLIHELVPLYGLLDWRGPKPQENDPAQRSVSSNETADPIPPAYAILRSWLHLAIFPRKDEAAEADGGIVHILATLNASQATRAVSRALHRLRIRGLPTTDDMPRPFGKSVPQTQIEVSVELASLLPLALLVPISSSATHRLAKRLLVESPHHEAMEITA
ncbi:MAG: type I-U CRISPR-associated protein Csx17 [Nevskia sp.]|nr:type I-U CRISPR-associated protein Csx17 [Nevskia sp.]